MKFAALMVQNKDWKNWKGNRVNQLGCFYKHWPRLVTSWCLTDSVTAYDFEATRADFTEFYCFLSFYVVDKLD